MIYLDNASTTKINDEVKKEIIKYLGDDYFFNPSSFYGEKNKQLIESARKEIANFINCDPEEIFFTSSGCEGNSWIIQSCLKTFNCYCCVSAIEHKSTIECFHDIKLPHSLIGVDVLGRINKKELEYVLSMFHTLISIQYANNEIGTIQNIDEISKIVHRYSGLLHVDATQAFGHIPIDVKESGIDFLTASGHKIGAPKGIGFVYIKKNIVLKPLIYGSQMDGKRGGTENLPYIMGLKKAVQIRREYIENKEYNKTAEMRQYFISELRKNFEIKINGDEYMRIPNNISVTFKENISAESLILILNSAGIYMSKGAACNTTSIEPSKVLMAIGLTEEEAAKTIRISIGDDISKDEIDIVISEMKKAIRIICG